MKSSQRTLERLRKQGMPCGVVERWIPVGGNWKAGKRVDLFGFIDIIALHPDDGIVGIQCFTTQFQEHRRKIIGECRNEALAWLDSGGHIELWGWRKLKVKKGGKAIRWTPRIERMYFEDFQYGNDTSG